MKNHCLIFSILSVHVLGQNITNSTGGNLYYLNMSIEYSIGETIIISTSNNLNNIVSGVLQPTIPNVSYFKETIFVPQIKVYPNATLNHILIDCDLTCIYQVHDSNGIKLQIHSTNNSIDFSNFGDGTYFLKVFNKKEDLIRVIKILKIS